MNIKQKNELFITSIQQNDISTIESLLLDEEIDPAFNSNCFILEAVLFGRLSIVKLLLNDSRVDPTERNNLPLRKAIEANYKKISLLILKKTLRNPNFNTKISWIFKKCKELKNHNVTKYILQNSDVIINKDYSWLLIIIIKYNNPELLKLYLQDERAIPEMETNWCINYANNHFVTESVDLLWNCKTVKDTLHNDMPKLFNKLTKISIQSKIKSF
jgi:hypothetical protein